MNNNFLALDTDIEDYDPWGERNQKMSFKCTAVFSVWSPGAAVWVEEANQQFSSPGWGRVLETRELHREESPEIYQGIFWVLAQILSSIFARQDAAYPGWRWLLKGCEVSGYYWMSPVLETQVPTSQNGETTQSKTSIPCDPSKITAIDGILQKTRSMNFNRSQAGRNYLLSLYVSDKGCVWNTIEL